MSPRFLKFLVVGGLGFVVDAGITMGLIRLGISPLVARPPAILAAMVFTWLANRQVTFAVRHRKTLGEVIRYSGVAIVAALLNYVIYSGLISLTVTPFVAIVIATALVAVFSFFGYKRFAFGLSARH